MGREQERQFLFWDLAIPCGKVLKEEVEKEGLLGESSRGGLTASSAGICGALVFGYLSSLVFQTEAERIRAAVCAIRGQ